MPYNNLRLLSICFATIYLLTTPWQPYPGSFIIKGLSVGLLAVLALRIGGVVSREIPILGLALGLSSVGDILLDINPDRLFVVGLGSFLLVHVIYSFLFLRNHPRPLMVDTPLLMVLLPLGLYVGALCAWLLPSLGGLMIPVAIYMIAIATMVVTSILARFPTSSVMIGAILFLISDSLLAINKFKSSVPYRDLLVWSTYYAGQYAITIGFLRAKLEPVAVPVNRPTLADSQSSSGL